MGVKTIRYRGNLGSADTNREPSANIWCDCPFQAIREGSKSGVCHHDDFDNWQVIGTTLPVTQTTQIGVSRYKVFNTGAGAVVPVTAVNSVEMGGGIIKNNVDTDNDSGSIADLYPSLFMPGLQTTSGKLWFEARICFSPITTNGLGWMLGLAETEQWTLATGVPFNGGDAITNAASFIGFRKPEDDTTTYDTVYSDRATSFTAIGDADGTGAVAYTWIKLGMIYDPARSADCVRFFINGLQLTNVMSRTTLTGTTNLKANALGPICAIVADSAGTAGEFYMDWWRWAQVLPAVSPV